MVTRAINLNLPLALHVRGPVKAMNSKPLTTAFGRIRQQQNLPQNYRIYKHCTTTNLEVELWL